MARSSTPPTPPPAAAAPAPDPWNGDKGCALVFIAAVLALAVTCIVDKALDHNIEVEKVRATVTE